MLDRCGATAADSVVDVGGGASRLVDHLLRRGHADITVVDVSAEALRVCAARVRATGSAAAAVTWVVTDVRDWTPRRRFHVWHDRAALHFLTDEADRVRYAALVREHLEPGGLLVVATFAPDGPQQCSGLPVHRDDAQSLARLFGPALEPLADARVEHRTPWGTVQPFTWAAFRRT
jgi:trans-aconitate methyltransferase